MREDLPEGLSLEGPGLGVLDARSTVEDGLSDRDDSSDDDEVVEISELERFASALQEAQRRAVRLEIEKAKWKRKTPKTYLGNSKATIARREKNRQALVSRGFHDVFTFLALKERGRLASGRSLEGGEPADCPLAGGVGETVPDRVQRVDQGIDASLNVGAWGAVDVSCHLSPGHVECDWNGGNRSRSKDANAGASTAISVLRHSCLGVLTTARGWTIKSMLGPHSMCLVARRLDVSNVVGAAAIDPAPGMQTQVLRPQSAYFVTHCLGVLTTSRGWMIKSMLGAHSTWLITRHLDVSNEVGTAAIDLAPGTQTQLLRLQSACFITHRLGVSTTAGGWTIKSALGAHSTWLVARRLNMSKEVGMGLNDPIPQRKVRESRTQSACPVTHCLGMSNVT